MKYAGLKALKFKPATHAAQSGHRGRWQLLEVKRVIRAVTAGRARQTAECVLAARTIAAVKDCLAAPAKNQANATAAAPRPAKTPAEAAWENEGGHILPLTGVSPAPNP